MPSGIRTLSTLRVIFVNRYFHPDESATGQLLAELASGLASEYPVLVVTSGKLSDDASAVLVKHEQWHGVRIFRVWTTRFGRASLWGRSLDYLSFFVSVVWFLARRVRPRDIVVLKTDPPLLQLVNTAVIRLKGGKVINWLQDLYPELAVRLGVFPGPKCLSDAITAWRDRALRVARANVVVSDAMARYLRSRGVTNTTVIPNWADEALITPVGHDENPLRTEWGLQQRLTVMYSGNFGRAHRFAEIAKVVGQFAAEKDIEFVFIGEGAGLGPLKERLGRERMGNYRFMPFQPKARLRFSLGAADLHLVTLKSGMEDLMMPSKIYGILAAGRPVAFVGDPDGDIAALIQRENLGFAIPPGDPEALAEAILRLKLDTALRSRQQSNARACFEAHYSCAQAVGHWLGLLRGIDGNGAGGPRPEAGT